MAPSGPVLVTWANLHYLDFVLNWVAHVRALGIRSYLVGAMDDGILQARPRHLRRMLLLLLPASSLAAALCCYWPARLQSPAC